MRFDDFSYLWPPRPEEKTPRSMFGFYQKKGWVALAKKNGTCNVIAVHPATGQLICMNRHNEDHKQWSPSKKSSAAFLALPGKGWYVFVAELLHSKIAETKNGVRDTNFLNDILVLDGDYLVGKTFEERQKLIADLFLKGGEKETVSHYVINENTWLAKTVKVDFKEFFNSLITPEDEGVVLKNPKAPLNICSRQASNTAWSVKSRRPTPNYQY